tara:strand:- start:3694 stop:5562 length:1869 start_codon:yes stop_codon:yes gene_type:complete
MIDAKELNRLLLAQVDRICSELLPDGRQRGVEFTCASMFGGKGTSFSLNTQRGLWKDFADDTKAGDLISLFIARAGNPKQGMKDAYDFLGIKQFDDKLMEQKPLRGPKKYTQPESDWYELDGPAYTYLVKERGLPENVLNAYEVSYAPDKWFSPEYHGPAYVFLYKTPSGKNNCLAKYVAVERDEDDKKRLTAQKNGLQVLFGMQHVKEDWCIITTGELDALSYAAQGLPAVSVTNGDKNTQWIENCWDFLDRLKTIYLSFDMDESGESMVTTVAARLGVAKCKRVILPYKDANKCHVEGISLHECIRTAKDITPSGFVRSADLANGVWDRLKSGPRDQRGIPFMGWDGIDETVNFRIRPQECTVYLGFEASGKSTLLYQLCAYLAGVYGEKIGIASLEEDPEEILGVMLTQWMGEGCTPQDGLDETDFRLRYEATIAENIFIYNDRTADAPLKDILSFAEYCVKRYGAKHVVIDSITCTDIDIEDNKDANKFMKSVIKSMNETGAHYHIVAHAKKGQIDEFERASIPKKRDIKGSVTIPALATNIVSMWRNGMKDSILQNKRQTKFSPEEVREWADAVIAIRKQKVGGKIGEFDLWYNTSNFRFRRKQNWPDSTYFKILST